MDYLVAHSTDRIENNPEEKDQISINRLATQFSLLLCPVQSSAQSELLDWTPEMASYRRPPGQRRCCPAVMG